MSDTPTKTPKTAAEMKKAAQAFVTGVVDLAMANGIPFDGVVTLLGIYAKTVVLTKVDQGTPRDEAFMSVVGDFMRGIGATPVEIDLDAEGDDNAPAPARKVH